MQRSTFGRTSGVRLSRSALSLVATAILFAACGQPDLVGKSGPIPGDDNSWMENASQARFVALGDLGSGSTDQQAVADSICEHRLEEPFDHVVTTGDNVYPQGETSDFTKKFIIPYECLLSEGVKFHAVLGNHDIKNSFRGLSEVDEPIFGFGGSPYYKWSLGPVTFLMADSQAIDSEIDNGGTGEHYEWLMEEAEKAQAEPWTVVVFHDPVFSSGTKHPSKPGWAERVGQPLAAAGVDLVLNGHDHNYQHAESDDVTYVVTGGGGGEIYPCSDPLVEPVLECIPEYHFVEVEIKGSTGTVSAISADGLTLDSFTFGPNP